VGSGSACPGFCNRRYREAREAYEQALALYDPLDPHQSRPEPPQVQPWEGEPVWCGPCASKISQRLHQLDDLWSLLQRYADGHREAPASPLVSASSETLSPSDAADAAQDIASLFTDWEAKYRGLRGWPSVRRDEDMADVITSCAAWLSAHLRGILASRLARAFGEGILDWHRELTGSTKAGTRKLTKPLRCPGCRQLTLTWVEGEESVHCSDPDCRVILRYQEYEAEVSRMAGMETGSTSAA
jgi:hypothetical protein